MEIDYEIISLYLEGKLSLEQKVEFENKLKTDKVFKEEYDLYVEVQNTLSKKYFNEQKVEDLKQSLKKITTPDVKIKAEDKFEGKLKPRPFIKSNFVKIIALAAVFAIGFFVMKPQTSLYNQYAQHSALEVQVKGENEVLLLEAAKLFNEKKYKEAIPKLDDYLMKNSDDIEVKISLGIAFLETNQIKEAQILFSQIYGLENVFRNKAAWYMALSYLKLEDIQQTKAFLGDIEKSSFYYEKAQKLLKKL